MLSRIDKDSLIAQIADIQREIHDEKNRQFIGSNQIIMKLSNVSTNTWDFSVLPYRSEQSFSDAGWNVVLITARAKNSNNLVADLAIRTNTRDALTRAIDVPLPPSQSNTKKWFVPVFGKRTQSIFFKLQVIANDDCDISWEEYQG